MEGTMRRFLAVAVGFLLVHAGLASAGEHGGKEHAGSTPMAAKKQPTQTKKSPEATKASKSKAATATPVSQPAKKSY